MEVSWTGVDSELGTGIEPRDLGTRLEVEPGDLGTGTKDSRKDVETDESEACEGVSLSGKDGARTGTNDWAADEEMGDSGEDWTEDSGTEETEGSKTAREAVWDVGGSEETGTN